MVKKSIYYLGTVTATTTVQTTLSERTGYTPVLEKSGFAFCNVLINATTLVGSGGGLSFSFQERFSDIGFVETAFSGTITSNGRVWLTRDPSAGTYSAYSGTLTVKGGFASLGNGTDKRLIMAANSVTDSSADVYIVFYDQGN